MEPSSPLVSGIQNVPPPPWSHLALDQTQVYVCGDRVEGNLGSPPTDGQKIHKLDNIEYQQQKYRPDVHTILLILKTVLSASDKRYSTKIKTYASE